MANDGNSMTMGTRIALADWLRQPGQTNGQTPTSLAKKATLALGHKFTFNQVSYMCRELKIPLTSRAAQVVSGDLAAKVLTLTTRVEEIEAQLRILQDFGRKEEGEETSSEPHQFQIPTFLMRQAD